MTATGSSIALLLAMNHRLGLVKTGGECKVGDSKILHRSMYLRLHNLWPIVRLFAKPSFSLVALNEVRSSDK